MKVRGPLAPTLPFSLFLRLTLVLALILPADPDAVSLHAAHDCLPVLRQLQMRWGQETWPQVRRLGGELQCAAKVTQVARSSLGCDSFQFGGNTLGHSGTTRATVASFVGSERAQQGLPCSCHRAQREKATPVGDSMPVTSQVSVLGLTSYQRG